MARDYSSRHDRDNRDKNGRPKPAKRSAAAAKSTRPKKTAAPRKTSSRPKDTGRRGATPGWVWGLCGLFIGIVVVSGWYIFSRPGGTPGDTAQVDISLPAADDDQQDEPAAKPAPPADADAPPAEKGEPRFSFYKMLPNYHVEVGDNGQSTSGGSAGASAPHEAAEPDNETRSRLDTQESAPQRSAATNRPQDNTGSDGTRYIIQAGAFSTADDADRRKAQLALLGVTSEVVDIRTGSGKTVYRVQSDPLGSPGQAQSLAQRLKSHGIETMVRQAD